MLSLEERMKDRATRNLPVVEEVEAAQFQLPIEGEGDKTLDNGWGGENASDKAPKTPKA